MKNLKRYLSMALAAALVLSMLAGCNSSTPPVADESQSSAVDSTIPDTSDTSDETVDPDSGVDSEPEGTDTNVGEEGLPPVGDNSDVSDKTDAENKPGTDDKNNQTSKPADDDKQNDTSKEDKTPEKDDEKQDAPVVNPKPEDKPVESDKPIETDPVHQHSYKDTVVKPTCTEKGYTTHTCSCGESFKDNEVAALGHKYTSKVVAPTTEAEGYTLYTCQTCGHNYKDNFVDKIVESKPESDVPASDLEDKKSGVTYVDAEDPNNLRLDNLGDYVYPFYGAGEGTVIRHSDLQMFSNNPSENVDHFFDAMYNIARVTRNGVKADVMGSRCGEYQVSGNSYQLTLERWGRGTKEGRNVYLNALVYFAGEDLGSSIWRMMDEFYRFRKAENVPITDELAAKYGLTIESLSETGVVMNISNGMDTVKIQYELWSPMSGQSVTIWVKA